VSHQIPFENLDRLLNVEMRRNGLPQGVMPKVYEVARGSGAPLTQRAVEDLNATTGTVGFLTGVYFPPHFENGEIDGPIGAVVLGSALTALGRQAEILIEEKLVPLVEALVQQVGSSVRVVAAESVTTEQVVNGWDALVSIERIGVAENGQTHSIVGTPFSSGFKGMDAIVNGMNAAGKPTIGIGDGGNEIGFGALYDTARQLSPHPVAWTVTATKHVLPVCVSNLGAYALTTGLAIVNDRLDLVPTADEVESLIRLANSLGCLDGGTVDPNFIGDDGIPMSGIRGYVDLMGTIASQYFTPFERHF